MRADLLNSTSEKRNGQDENGDHSSDSVTVIDNRNGRTVTIPIFKHQAIPAAPFKTLNLQIVDDSYGNSAVAKSSICLVDGEKGKLFYRNYEIEDLVENSTFLEVAFLLIYGELPVGGDLGNLWNDQVMTHTFLHVSIEEMMKSFNYDAHPMGLFISTMAALATHHPESNPALQGPDCLLDNDKLMNKQIKRIIGKVTTVAANAYRHRIGRQFNHPSALRGYAENFLYMLDALDEPDYKPAEILVETMDKMFIIHAEHELNCSTATMMMVGSSRVDPFSAVAASAAALYGPLHGGANASVVRMLEEIGSIEAIPAFLESVKSKKCKLMGFGHRVYKTKDPRASLVKKILDNLCKVIDADPLYALAQALEKAALSDSYFQERNLYPNVDFWSGLVYKTMGFPCDFFPLLFAVPRTVGWLAHWREQMKSNSEDSACESNGSIICEKGGGAGNTNGKCRIWRPRQIFTGSEKTEKWIPVTQRQSRKTINENTIASDSQAMYLRYKLGTERYKQK